MEIVLSKQKCLRAKNLFPEKLKELRIILLRTKFQKEIYNSIL
jgi:hypothetical protein